MFHIPKYQSWSKKEFDELETGIEDLCNYFALPTTPAENPDALQSLFEVSKEEDYVVIRPFENSTLTITQVNDPNPYRILRADEEYATVHRDDKKKYPYKFQVFFSNK